VDTALVVISAQTGIELTAERMFDLAGERGLCRMIVINKIDADNIDLSALVEQVRERLASNACCSTCRPSMARTWSSCWAMTTVKVTLPPWLPPTAP
jgi:peptide subunit release factor RF-3